MILGIGTDLANIERIANTLDEIALRADEIAVTGFALGNFPFLVAQHFDAGFEIGNLREVAFCARRCAAPCLERRQERGCEQEQKERRLFDREQGHEGPIPIRETRELPVNLPLPCLRKS